MTGNDYEASRASWVLAAALPPLCQMSLPGALAWVAALLIGACVADGRLVRWVAVAWAASAVAPAVPVVAVAASGAMGAARSDVLRMAGVGLLCAVLWPNALQNAGMLLLAAVAVLAALRKDA